MLPFLLENNELRSLEGTLKTQRINNIHRTWDYAIQSDTMRSGISYNQYMWFIGWNLMNLEDPCNSYHIGGKWNRAGIGTRKSKRCGLSESLSAAGIFDIKHHCQGLKTRQGKKAEDVRRWVSRYHFCLACSRILICILCYFLREAIEKRKVKVMQRTGPFPPEPAQTEDCQMCIQWTKAAGIHSIFIKLHGETSLSTSHSYPNQTWTKVFPEISVDTV